MSNISYDKSQIIKISNNKRGGYDYSISCIRFIALLFIITCHMMQHESYVLANWFNVGVQVFLCISVFLYGLVPKKNTIEFYHSRFLKILVPYYIVYLSFGLIEFIFFREVFSVPRFLSGIFCRAFISGAGHLWYVSLILLCYILTPLLQIYRDQYIQNKNSWLLYSLCTIFIISISFGLFNTFFSPAWLCCYAIGFILATNKGYYENGQLTCLFGALALICNSIQIYIDYILCLQFHGLRAVAYKIFTSYNHTLLGVFIFLFLKIVLDKFQWKKMVKTKKFLDVSDSYSYECYLVHQLVILGPFSLMSITHSLSLNIVLIVLVITMLTVSLKFLEVFVMNNINIVRKSRT